MGMSSAPSEEALMASRQMIYVLFQRRPGEQCVSCVEALPTQYEQIRVALTEQMQSQRLTPERLASFAQQMKELALLPQRLCRDCRAQINQHLLQVECFDACVLTWPNRPFCLPAQVVTAMTKRNGATKYQRRDIVPWSLTKENMEHTRHLFFRIGALLELVPLLQKTRAARKEEFAVK
jgi:hypothetical protein